MRQLLLIREQLGIPVGQLVLEAAVFGEAAAVVRRGHEGGLLLLGHHAAQAVVEEAAAVVLQLIPYRTEVGRHAYILWTDGRANVPDVGRDQLRLKEETIAGGPKRRVVVGRSPGARVIRCTCVQLGCRAGATTAHVMVAERIADPPAEQMMIGRAKVAQRTARNVNWRGNGGRGADGAAAIAAHTATRPTTSSDCSIAEEARYGTVHGRARNVDGCRMLQYTRGRQTGRYRVVHHHHVAPI